MDRPDKYDRYLALVAWSRSRYKDGEGAWITWVGNGVAGLPCVDGKAFMVPTRYTVIEELAAARYLGITHRRSGFTLATAHRVAS